MEPLTSTRYRMLNVKAVWTRLDIRCIVAYTHIRSKAGVLLYSLRVRTPVDRMISIRKISDA